jgi:hypothetical protein
MFPLTAALLAAAFVLTALLPVVVLRLLRLSTVAASGATTDLFDHVVDVLNHVRTANHILVSILCHNELLLPMPVVRLGGKHFKETISNLANVHSSTHRKYISDTADVPRLQKNTSSIAASQRGYRV